MSKVRQKYPFKSTHTSIKQPGTPALKAMGKSSTLPHLHQRPPVDWLYRRLHSLCNLKTSQMIAKVRAKQTTSSNYHSNRGGGARFSLSARRSRARKRKTRNILDAAIPSILCQVSCTSHWCIQLPRFMRLVGSHSETHPTQEWRASCLVGSGEEQKAPTGPEAAAQARG